MADTVIHEHVGHESETSTGLILAVVFLLILAFLIIFGLPIVRNMSTSSSPQINVPDKVDVNIQPAK